MPKLLQIFLIAVSMPLWIPIFCITAFAVKITIGSPIFFKQLRPGLRGKPFTLIKFRTMKTGDSADEARMTKFGRFLRGTSLDELPELFNVLRGEMALVGPRPLLMQYLPLYSEKELHRHDVLPGITGWAQVNGRNAISWEKKFEYDLEYIKKRSTRFDLYIIFRTFLKIFTREGTEIIGAFQGKNKE